MLTPLRSALFLISSTNIYYYCPPQIYKSNVVKFIIIASFTCNSSSTNTPSCIMLRPRRQIGGEVCPPPCNLRQDQAGDKWVSHTTTCPAWLRAHAHLFQPSPRVQDLGPDSGSIGQLEEDALNNIMRTPTESTVCGVSKSHQYIH